jgi:hypothetical protein
VTGTRRDRSRQDASPPVILSVEGTSPAGAPDGRGAAAHYPTGLAAAAGAAVPIAPHGGACGTPQGRAGGDGSDPSLPPVLDPAPGSPETPPGAEGGLVEPCAAPARNAPAPCGSGDQGIPPAGACGAPGGRTAALGNALPGAAMTSLTAKRGAGRARGDGPGGGATSAAGPVPAEAPAPVPGGPGAGRGRGARGDSSAVRAPSPQEPGGAARTDAAAPPAPLRDEAFRKTWRAALSADAKDRRNGRSRWPVKRLGAKYGPGMTRRQPPPGGAA